MSWATQIWREAMRPDARLSVSEWADKHRVLSTKSSAEAGVWRTSRTPYLREIQDSLSDPEPSRVVFMKGAQIGGTEAGNNFIGWAITQAPSPILMVTATLQIAGLTSTQRIDTMVAACPALSEVVAPPREKDGENSKFIKSFNGGILRIAGANSPASLASMPVRFLFCDEVDHWPGDVGGEGDPVELAVARTSTFQTKRKIFMVSTPLMEGESRIAREYETSDQRVYEVPCPRCGTLIELLWSQMRWGGEKNKGLYYECQHCGGIIEEHEKTSMLADGVWRAKRPERSAFCKGYQLSSLYSPYGWSKWSEMVDQYERAHEIKRQTGDDSQVKVFVNTKEGRAYRQDGMAPPYKSLWERRSLYKIGFVDRAVMFLTAGADVQADRIEVEVVGWGAGRRSWSIDYKVLAGDTTQPEVWQQLGALLKTVYDTADGRKMRIALMAVDSGYRADDVYSFARSQSTLGFGRGGMYVAYPMSVACVKGATGLNPKASFITAVSGWLSGDPPIKVLTINTGLIKSEIYRFLNQALPEDGLPPPGWCQFPVDYGPQHFQQLTSEKQVLKVNRKGRPTLVWEQHPSIRNEPLDCRVYASLAAHVVVGNGEWEPERLEYARTLSVIPSDPAPLDVPPQV